MPPQQPMKITAATDSSPRLFWQILLQLLTLALLSVPLSTYATGFSLLAVELPEEKPLQIGIWYPTDSPVPENPNSPFGQALALNAPIKGKDRPLILISHGYGGWLGSHANTALALAQAGFVVAAPSHSGNTFGDMSSPSPQWVLDRPRHISQTIDQLTKHWPQREALRDGKVGIFGFSAGGLTALNLIGALPNLDRAASHCESVPEEFACKEGLVASLAKSDLPQLPPAAWGADRRIGAAAIAAPGLGIAFDANALAGIEVPVQLWSGLEDKRVPHNSNAQPIADALDERAEFHWIEDAGHFSFLLPRCRPALKQSEPDTWELLCVDKPGFDRQAFHQHMNRELVRFFRQQLQD
ncbi:alpha/beta hydrolase family protein [Marinobacterium jannaschii]|uniref:alpha/beta hydrolase family protein n=1 Tax=Marinobacterium jannaschii TaxID=64970 RepID=UPI000686496F|nr:alpha/beta fold hydrolase [Marinobacterium jannaschii]